jgi:uncharacterized membrane protein
MIDSAHIHPMLVHFPIVLLPLGSLLYFVVAFRGDDLAARHGLSVLAFLCLAAGLLTALLAAGFGDVALEAAMDKGFDEAPLEKHEDLAGSTIAVFGLLVLVQAFALWRGYPLKARKAWLQAVIAVAGVALLLITAYHGGQLVYERGVNVAPVKP